MQAEINQLAAIFKAVISRTGVIPGPTARLGKGDGLGTLKVPNGRPNEVYLHDPVTHEIHVAYLDPTSPLVVNEDGHPEIETIEVSTGYRYGSTQLTVLGPNTLAAREALGTTTPMQAYWNQGYWTTPSQITILRPRPTSPVTQVILIDIFSAPLKPSTMTLHYQSTVAVDLTTQIAALSAGQHQFVLPYYNRETFETGVLTQTAVSATNTLGTAAAHAEFTSADVDNFTGISTDMMLSDPLEIWYGMGSVGESSFYRDIVTRQVGGASAGAGNGLLQDIIDVTITIPAKFQANYAEEVTIEDGGELILDGRLYIGS